jgi:hypothetical protein
MCGGSNGLIGGLFKEVGKAVGINTDQPSSAGAGPSPAQAQALADTSAAQASNAKLAARNKRRGASLLATGAGDTGSVQTTFGKSVLGA